MRQAPSQLDAGLLGDVLGVGAMAAPFPGDPVDRRVVQVQKLGEGGGVAALRLPNETFQLLVVHAGFFVWLPSIRRRRTPKAWNSYCESSSSRRLSVRGPNPPMVTTITTIAPPMNNATPMAPSSCRKNPIRRPASAALIRLQE